ncbi:MAG: hypothetical protein AAGA53_02980 [Pseudomonadota bacterium]
MSDKMESVYAHVDVVDEKFGKWITALLVMRGLCFVIACMFGAFILYAFTPYPYNYFATAVAAAFACWFSLGIHKAISDPFRVRNVIKNQVQYRTAPFKFVLRFLPGSKAEK